jgi:hypothetical protein
LRDECLFRIINLGLGDGGRWALGSFGVSGWTFVDAWSHGKV